MLFMLIDGLIYAVTLFFVINVVMPSAPKSIVNHTNVALIVGWLCFYLVSSIYPLQVTKRRIQFYEVLRRSMTVALVTQVIFAFVWHTMSSNSSHEIEYGVFMTITLMVFMSLVRGLEAYILMLTRRKGRNKRYVCLVGEDPSLLQLYMDMKLSPDTGYEVIGYYGDTEISNAPDGLVRLGNRKDFLDIIEGKKLENGEVYKPRHLDEIYCSVSRADQAILLAAMRFCDKSVTRFFYVPRVYNSRTLSLKPEIVNDMVIYTNHYEPLSLLGNRIIKRMFDILFSSLVLLCMIPFVPIIAFLIKRQSPGPIIFTQLRTGLGGRDFMCYKFRSMHLNKESDTLQATKDDPRKFAFGHFMREHNIDELPQFYNVLKGDMSVVGPRPHMKLHTEQYSAIIDRYMVRHFEKPGITGLAQVTGYRGETKTVSQMEGRIERDIWYIEHWSFWLDLKICWKTAVGFFIKDTEAC